MSSPTVNLIGSGSPEGNSSATFPSTIADLEAPKKKPKRVLHFSDGILEEFSSDEEDDDVERKRHSAQCYRSQSSATVPVKDPRHMRWGEFLLHLSVSFGVKSLNFCDYLGEKFAWMLGITTPKYGYAVDERAWRDKEEAAEAEREERERAARAKRNAIGPDGGGAESRVSVEKGVDLNDESEILSSEKERF